MSKFTKNILAGGLLCTLLAGCSSTGKLARLGELVPERIARIAAPAAGEQSAGPAVADEVKHEYDRAVAALQSGDTSAAEAQFEKLAAAHPKLAGPHLNLALIHLQAGRVDEAAAALEAALARNASSAPAHNLTGIVLRRQGDFKGAERAYRAAVAVDDRYPHAWRNLGVLYDLYLQQPQRALDAYQRYQALTREPDKEVALWISDLTRRYGNTGRTAQAGEP